MRTHRGLAGLALALLIAVGGCVRAADPGPDPGATGSNYSPTDLVVQVKEVGGFIAPTTLATRLPIVSVYGDGRVVTVGPQIDIYPGPALPNVLVQRISRADVARLAAMARAAGVGSPDTAQPTVADAPTTRFTVRTASGLFTTDAEALGLSEGAGLTPKQRLLRSHLQALLNQLTDLPHTLGTGAVSKAEPYQPIALTAVARPSGLPDPNAPTNQREMAWPGPTLPGQTLNPALDLHCILVTGDSLTPVLDAAAKANRATPWGSAGRFWLLEFRPLLPDERDCGALGQT
jgi:hypothetical protein